MTDSTLEKLETEIRRAVLPITASPRRKRLMREELLAHLLGSVEQEIAIGHDESAATLAAATRFGNVENLRQDLQKSVPVFERIIFSLLPGKDKKMWRILWLVGVLAVLVGMALILPAVAKWKLEGSFNFEQAAFLTAGVVIVAGGLGSCGVGVKRFRTRAH